MNSICAAYRYIVGFIYPDSGHYVTYVLFRTADQLAPQMWLYDDAGPVQGIDGFPIEVLTDATLYVYSTEPPPETSCSDIPYTTPLLTHSSSTSRRDKQKHIAALYTIQDSKYRQIGTLSYEGLVFYKLSRSPLHLF